jgi:hypothetical protein
VKVDANLGLRDPAEREPGIRADRGGAALEIDVRCDHPVPEHDARPGNRRPQCAQAMGTSGAAPDGPQRGRAPRYRARDRQREAGAETHVRRAAKLSADRVAKGWLGIGLREVQRLADAELEPGAHARGDEPELCVIDRLLARELPGPRQAAALAGHGTDVAGERDARDGCVAAEPGAARGKAAGDREREAVAIDLVRERAPVQREHRLAELADLRLLSHRRRGADTGPREAHPQAERARDPVLAVECQPVDAVDVTAGEREPRDPRDIERQVVARRQHGRPTRDRLAHDRGRVVEGALAHPAQILEAHAGPRAGCELLAGAVRSSSLAVRSRWSSRAFPRPRRGASHIDHPMNHLSDAGASRRRSIGGSRRAT